MDGDIKSRGKIQEEELKLLKEKQRLEAKKFQEQRRNDQQTQKLERQRIAGEKNWFLQQGEKIKGSGFPGLILFLGFIFHILQGISSGWSFYRTPNLFWIQIFIGVVVVVYSGIGDRNKLVKNSIIVISILLFEWFYYDAVNVLFRGASVPYFLSKMFWNGWIIAGAFTGFNTSKISKFISWAVVLFLIGNLFVYLPIDNYLSKQTASVKTEDTGKGFFDMLSNIGDEFSCSMADPSLKQTCLKEKEWERKRKNPEIVAAMEETCSFDISQCDCHVYMAEKKEECFEKKSKIRDKEISSTTKETAAMEVEFDAPKSSESYSKTVKIEPTFNIISPNKEVDIGLNCEITNKKEEEIISDFEKIEIAGVKTDENLGLSRRFSCGSKGDVSTGEYTFKISSLIKNIETKASFIGLYTHPQTLISYKERADPGFEELLENEINTAYPTKEVQSVSDPDLTLLSFNIEPVTSQGVEGVSGLKSGSEFVLVVSLKNNKAGSKIEDVSSIEFLIPNIFTTECSDIYSSSESKEGFSKISVQKDVLDNINFEKISSRKDSVPISDLSCSIKANTDLQSASGVTPLMFEGTITYSQEVFQEFKVRRVG